MSEEKRRRCFVIGPIGKEGSIERKHADMLLYAVVREALKDCDPPYEVVRSDQIADPGMITDRMIHEIMNAELVVADLTFLNANAFYELGIRHAAEKPVIHFAQADTELPFDAMTHRAILEDITSWGGIEGARQRIREAAKVIEASDYRVSNPITQANASFKMRKSADPSEQVIADLQTRVARLEAHGRGRRLEPDELHLLSLLPRISSDVDRMLLAGYVAQLHSPDQSFSPDEAKMWLNLHGIETSNASQSVKQNLLAKRVFKHQGRYRLSQIGGDYLADLMTGSN
jgi:hypothetical protein